MEHPTKRASVNPDRDWPDRDGPDRDWPDRDWPDRDRPDRDRPDRDRPDRRQHERAPVRADVLLSQNGRSERMAVHDISLSGAFLVTTLHDHIGFKIGARCSVVVNIDECVPTHEVDDGHTVHAQARIVRREPGAGDRPAGLGVEFEHLDLENLEKLRALVYRAG